MTHIDFYILPQSGEDARRHFACRLAEKAWRLGHRVQITVDNAREADALGDLLWQYRPESFLPHQRLDDPAAAPAPVALAYGDQQDPQRHLLINLSSTVPDYFSGFPRLSEVVCQDEPVLKTSRQRYRFYQERGYPVEHRKL